MEQQAYLVDTNVIIDYLGNRLPQSGMLLLDGVVDAGVKISVITKIELLGFVAPAPYYQLISNFVSESLVLGITEDVVSVCIEIRKACRIKLPDAIIAATAISQGLELLTRNIKDFEVVKSLKVLNPHRL